MAKHRSGWAIGSPKTFAAVLAGITSILLWIIAIAAFWKGTFTGEELVALTTGTTAGFTALLAYLMPDRGHVIARSFTEHPVEEVPYTPIPAEQKLRNHTATTYGSLCTLRPSWAVTWPLATLHRLTASGAAPAVRIEVSAYRAGRPRCPLRAC